MMPLAPSSIARPQPPVDASVTVRFPAAVGFFNALTKPLRAGPENPLFPSDRASVAGALERLEDYAATRAVQPRPLLVLAGYRAPWFQATSLARAIACLTGWPLGTGGGELMTMAYPWSSDLSKIIDRVARAAFAKWPAADGSRRTLPLDVVGASMGGLVARGAALPATGDGADADRPTLTIARLFTLATPHRGATLAAKIALEPASRAMKPGSRFLAHLDAAPRDYELVPYAVLRDHLVGAPNAAPPGMEPLWVPGPRLVSHHVVCYHPAILADMALRLTGLPPLATGSSRPPMY